MDVIVRPTARGIVTIVLALAALLCAAAPLHAGGTAAPDSLELQTPEDVRAWSVYNPTRRTFTVWLTWDDPPDSCATYVHPADTTGWSVKTPPSLLSLPVARGPYTGDIDRTFVFTARDSGFVGQPQELLVSCVVRKEEHFEATLDAGNGYVVGDYLPILFDDTRTPARESIDFGVQIAFGAGQIDQPGGFTLGVEDFEGFHVWRGITPEGSDLISIMEISKEEAFFGRSTGGSLQDSIYLYDVLPVLRADTVWNSPFGTIDCLGTSINMAAARLDPNDRTATLGSKQMFWFDCNTFNGFTYYYGVTTFDRGYEVGASRQGLVKKDHCASPDGLDMPRFGVPYLCADELLSVKMEVDSQDELRRVYAVPNPFRTGGSRLTTQNYHAFPDGVVRFVNVPANSMLKIYTLAGDLVWETDHSGPAGNVEWGTQNLSGETVTSGVYIFRVEDSRGQSMFGRLVIIR